MDGDDVALTYHPKDGGFSAGNELLLEGHDRLKTRAEKGVVLEIRRGKPACEDIVKVFLGDDEFGVGLETCFLDGQLFVGREIWAEDVSVIACMYGGFISKTSYLLYRLLWTL